MTDIETFARAEGAKVFGCAEGEVERLRAEIVAVHGEIDDLYERLYEAAHIRFLSTRDYKAACSMALDGLVDKSLTHTSTCQEVLDLSVRLVGKKVRGDGWGWGITA